MALCEVCGNDNGKAFQVTHAELQKQRCRGVEIVALTDPTQRALNPNSGWVGDDLFNEVLADYCARLETEIS